MRYYPLRPRFNLSYHDFYLHSTGPSTSQSQASTNIHGKCRWQSMQIEGAERTVTNNLQYLTMSSLLLKNKQLSLGSPSNIFLNLRRLTCRRKARVSGYFRFEQVSGQHSEENSRHVSLLSSQCLQVKFCPMTSILNSCDSRAQSTDQCHLHVVLSSISFMP